MTFSAINKAPGVYIDEVQLPGPIAGVGTSTAAFVGPARTGPINQPTAITNWTQFVDAFGVADDLGPYITAPQVFVTHAVRGFFDNGGANCYFVRVGTAARASLILADRGAGGGKPALVVTAKDEGAAGNTLQVAVQDANIAQGVNAVRAEGALANASNDQATLANAADAAKFLPGDIVVLIEGAKNERAEIASIAAAVIKLKANLQNTFGGGTLRIADLSPGQAQIRVDQTAGIEPGTYLSIAQAAVTEVAVVQAVVAATKTVALSQPLTKTYTMAAADPAVTMKSAEFTLKISQQGGGAETFDKLSMDARHSRYFRRIVASTTADVDLADPPSPNVPPSNLPAVLAATALAGGKSDDISQIGTPEYKAGIDALERIDEVNIICVPDRTDQSVQTHMIDHCESMQDRFAILDPAAGAAPADIATQRGLVSSDGGYGALYYPRIVIDNPVADGELTIPPSGHMAGVYARTDDRRGVHKAPANEAVRAAIRLERTLTDDEQGPLNEQGINVIRAFPGSGIRVWGARTIAPKDRTQWRYVNVRRLLLFLEESIQEGTQFAVFEPNNLSLWGQLKRQVTDFLTRVWKDGALFGATADEAFRVRIDDELNPPDLIALGQLTIEVIVRPTTPAEFVIFRIISDTTGKSLIKE